MCSTYPSKDGEKGESYGCLYIVFAMVVRGYSIWALITPYPLIG